MQFLQQPYPFSNDSLKRLRSAFLISLFVFVFLYIFRPFGIDRLENVLKYVSGYGIVTFLVMTLTGVIIPFLFPESFAENSWSVKKEIRHVMLIVLFIATGNLIFSNYMNVAEVSIRSFISFSFFTILIAVIPVTVSVLIKQNYLLKKNLRAANKLTADLYKKNRLISTDQLTTLKSENGKDVFSCKTDDICYIKAAENYVEIFYLETNTIKSSLLRATMKSVHESLKANSQFYRCHRTYIINLQKVFKISGNAQGYRILIENCPETIPVSRTLNSEIAFRISK
jgi:DNA-binding LytR/AlgR family response regulator